MVLRVITPPAGRVLTAAEVGDHLGMAPDEIAAATARLEAMIDAVTSWAERHRWLGRSLLEQRLELEVDWTFEPISLPRPPLIAIEAVSLVGQAGSETAIAADDWRLTTPSTGIPEITLRSGLPWPPAGARTVRVRYRAGYGPTGAAVDPGIRHALLMTVARLNEQRGEAVATSYAEDPFIRELFAPYRVFL